MQAEIINVGTELLIGSTLNTHQQFLARELGELGIDLYTAVTLGDNPQRLSSALLTALMRSDLVLLTGGLGPTDDDITVKAAARALGLDLVLDPSVHRAIQHRLERHGRKMNAFQARQALIPRGARVFPNPHGTAPGIFITQKRREKICHVALLPGPPRELKPMVRDHLTPALKKILGPDRQTLVVKRLFFPGAVESEIAPKVNDWLNASPPVTMGIYARPGEVELAVMSKHLNARQAELAAEKVERAVLRRFTHRLVLRHPQTLLSLIADTLTRKRRTLAVAESCTGGLLAGRATERPGSSAYFLGGVTAYNNRIKTGLLGVENRILRKHGAVSEAVARQMAVKTRELFGSDYALATTGIAGPDGGTKSKPVGLVYIALAGPGAKGGGVQTQVFEHRFLGDRSSVRSKTVQHALLVLAQTLKSASAHPKARR